MKGSREIYSLVNCPNLVVIFCQGLKLTINFLNISSNPAPLVSNISLINHFYQRNYQRQNFNENVLLTLTSIFSFVRCPNFESIFLDVWHWIFCCWNNSSVLDVSEFIDQYYLPNKLRCPNIFDGKLFMKILNRDINPGDSWPYWHMNYLRCI